MFLIIDVIKIDVLVVDVLELDVLGVRPFFSLSYFVIAVKGLKYFIVKVR